MIAIEKLVSFLEKLESTPSGEQAKNFIKEFKKENNSVRKNAIKEIKLFNRTLDEPFDTVLIGFIEECLKKIPCEH